jgi:hypothetical protein
LPFAQPRSGFTTMDDRQRIRTVNLTATCGDLYTAVAFLKGALVACGGKAHFGGTQTEHSRTVEFEFEMVTLQDMYCVLALAGLRLPRQSHYALTALCHLLPYRLASDESLLRVSLLLFDRNSDPAVEEVQVNATGEA